MVGYYFYDRDKMRVKTEFVFVIHGIAIGSYVNINEMQDDMMRRSEISCSAINRYFKIKIF